MKRVVIIGGGISGLATAYSLREHQELGNVEEFEILLIDSNPRVGGNIKTEKHNGFIVEGGPDCFISEKPWALALCRRIGLTDELLVTNDKLRKTFVLSKGKLHVLPEGVILMVPTKMIPLAFSTLISFGGKIRMAMEYFIPKRRSTEDETLGSFVRRRLGAEALDKIAEPLVAGIHAGDPETMSVRASFPKFVEMENEYGSLIKGMIKRMAKMKGKKLAAASGAAKGVAGAKPAGKVTMFMSLKGGMTTLIDKIAEIVLSKPNTRIWCSADADSIARIDDKFRIGISDGSTIEADAVVIAAPANAASRLTVDIDPELSEKLKSIPYVSTATISIAYKKADIAHPMNGFGFVVPGSEKRRIMASTWTSIKFSGRAPDGSVLIRCFVGGSRNMELVDLSDTEMIELVKSELSDIMGITAEPELARVFRFKRAMPQYTVGHEERVAWIDERVEATPGLYLTGSAYHGIGIADSIRYGEITAKKVLHRIEGK
jgi:oxygen-dependent protoporphyrinogen oxidase